MKRRKATILSVIMIVSVISISYFTLEFILNKDTEQNQNNEKVELIEWGSGKLFKVLVDPKDFEMINGKQSPSKATFGLREDLEQTYEEIAIHNEDKKSLFIIPIFTASAYSENAFYNYFNGNCDNHCLTTKIVSEDKLNYNSSANAVKILRLLGYDSITDLELHKNPNILNNYDKIILLHNEYVSKIMFDAITSHSNVIFLYPNSLYGEIVVNESNNEITLIRGHGIPISNISNGFDWENENTHPYEFDNKCLNWEFYSISNGHMLNCYPEQKIWQDKLFLKFLKDL